MQVAITIRADTEQGRYLIACARLRNFSMTYLTQSLVDHIASDQIVEAVLDDNGKPAPIGKRKHHFRHVRRPDNGC